MSIRSRLTDALTGAVNNRLNAWAESVLRADPAPRPDSGAPDGPVPAVLRDGVTSSAFLPSGLAMSGWANPITGLGAPGVDPAAAVSFLGRRLPLPLEIDRLYTHDWLADRIIEKMTSICMVRGVRIAGAGPDGGAELLDAFEQLNTTDRFPHGAFQRGVNDGRAHGGSVMLIGYAKGAPETPLTAEQAAGGILFLDLFAQHELEVLARWSDPRSADFGMPALYRVIAGASGGPTHPRYGQVFHASRSIRFAGRPLRVPNTISAAGSGGAGDFPEIGVSVLAPVLNDIARYGLSWASVANMLQDASIGVLKMGGLVEALASEDRDMIEERLRLLQSKKGSHRLMILDSDNNEEFLRTEVKLTDVPNVLDKILVSVSGAADCPARILFSTSPGGLNAQTGSEADCTHFYNSCADYQKRYLGPKLSRLLTAVNGGKPVKVEWPSLWESSDNEKAQTRLALANADKVYWDMGYSAEQIGKARSRGLTVELLGEAPADTRDDVAGAGGEPDAGPDGGGPQGAPGKQGASKIAKEQRAAQK